ncbi:CsgG/HfaB family protein [Aquifex aeolicus]|uniref:Curli production assembly/transport component CsgG n=1 Tax=Aquifex aeolicus (strain VF5) TaxID=224324 RepID=O67219_AQUAE|nr:CsgG/HfaB family protein [Aquifex aeolicus]AAC07181.1 putative protein [Aquifex aeolicus VF5]
MFPLLVISVIFLIFSCGPVAQQASTQTTQGEYAKDIRQREPELPKCDRPIGTIVARGFKCKAAQCAGDRIVFGPNYTVEVSPKVLGDGLSDMLVTALVKTGCFRVLERETLQEIKEELEMLGVQPKKALKGADFLLTGSITALEMKASGMGGGGVVVPLPFLGGVGVKAGKSSAHIALDLRLVRVRDAEVLLAETVEGKSDRWKFGVGGGGIFGTTIAGGWFEAFKNTPMEEATRDLIYHAVKLIVAQVRDLPPEKGSVSEEKTEAKQEQTAGIIKRPSRTPVHGDKILWEEDFSTCRVKPTSLKILKGSVECVEMNGKKWVADVGGGAVLRKYVNNFNPEKDWTLEYTFYKKQGKGMYAVAVEVSIGRETSAVNVKHVRNETYLGGQRLKDKDMEGKVHTVHVVKKGNTVSVFMDGKLLGEREFSPITFKRLKRYVYIKLYAGDIDGGDYAFITDIKLSSF